LFARRFALAGRLIWRCSEQTESAARPARLASNNREAKQEEPTVMEGLGRSFGTPAAIEGGPAAGWPAPSDVSEASGSCDAVVPG